MSRPDRRKRKLAPEKPVTPEVYKSSLEEARARSLKRRHGPILALKPGSNELSPPYSDHGEDWRYIVVDTFGTRSHAVASVFIDQLAGLVRATWDEEHKEWVPDEAELMTLLHVVSAHRPRNEAEAMLAAQIAAAHILTMKCAERAARYPWDSKSVSSFTKLACTSAALVDAMGRLKGKKRSTKQSIVVRHEKHVHYHQHAHLGGSPADERQPDTTTGGDGLRKTARARQPEERPALPSPEEAGRIVSFPGSEGEEGLPYARRVKAIGGAEG